MLFLQNKKLNALAHTIHALNYNTLTPADTKSTLNTQPQPQTDRHTDRHTDGPLTGTVLYRETSRPSHTDTENTDSRLGSQKDANDSFISTFLYRYFFYSWRKCSPLFFHSFPPPPFFSSSFYFFVSTVFLRASLELNWSRPGHAVQSAARATSRLATGMARAVKGRNRARESTLLDPHQGVVAEDNWWDTTDLQFQSLRADSGLCRLCPRLLKCRTGCAVACVTQAASLALSHEFSVFRQR